MRRKIADEIKLRPLAKHENTTSSQSRILTNSYNSSGNRLWIRSHLEKTHTADTRKTYATMRFSRLLVVLVDGTASTRG